MSIVEGDRYRGPSLSTHDDGKRAQMESLCLIIV